MGLSTVTLTGTFAREDGQTAQGWLTFTASADLSDTDNGLTVSRRPITVFLDDGSFEVELYAYDSTNVQPQNWHYQVVQNVDGRKRAYRIALPEASPTAVLADVIPVEGVTEEIWTVPAQGPEGDVGPEGPQGDAGPQGVPGEISAAQLATAIGDHEAAADPHAGYLTGAEAAALYEDAGAVATHEAAADPHAGYVRDIAATDHGSMGATETFTLTERTGEHHKGHLDEDCTFDLPPAATKGDFLVQFTRDAAETFTDTATSLTGTPVLSGTGPFFFAYFTVGDGTWYRSQLGATGTSVDVVSNVATDRLLGRDTAGSGDSEELTVGGGVEFTGTGGIQRSALTGDVTATAGSGATTIANDAVSNVKLANVATATVKARATSGTGDPEDLTMAQFWAIYKAQQVQALVVPIGDETTAITTTGTKVTFRMPYAFTITGVRASLTTASSSGIPTFDINEATTSILSTKLTIDAGEKTSTTAATAAVISDTALADDAEITIDVDVTGTGAAGAKITILGYRA